MKKIFVSVLVLTAFLTVGFPGRGVAQTTSLTVEELQAQIQALLEQIQQLQAQLSIKQGSEIIYTTPTISTGPMVTVTPGQKFQVGDNVQAVDYLNIRESPGGPALGLANPGYDGVIIAGPTQSGAYFWWQIKWSKGNMGWSVEDWLDKKDITTPGWSAESNKAPYFADDSFVSPTNVGADDSNWWRVKGYDPEGGDLKYTINWGDGTSNTYSLRSGGDVAAYHVYSDVGSYRIEAKVGDNKGTTASRFLTVGVIDSGAVLGEPSTKFKAGDGIQTTDNLNVRTGPSGVSEGIQLPGAKGVVTGGPVWSIMGGWWWVVDYDTGVDGWSAEDWLVKISKDEMVLPKVSVGTCGDIDGNGVINQNDLDNPASENDLTGYVFGGVPIPAGVNADLNGDGVPNILDVTFLINHLNRGAAAPTCVAKTNTAPSILDVSDVPPRILAGQNVNLSWTAKDVDGDPLEWSVSWGDGTVSACSTNCSSQYAASHAWSITGNYKVEAKVHDGKIWSGPHSFTVQVAPVEQKNIVSTPICGDVNQDGVINSDDLTKINDYVFGGVSITDNKLVDMNGDGSPDIIDVTLLINFLNRGGAAPTCGGQGAQAPTIAVLSGPNAISAKIDAQMQVTPATLYLKVNTVDPEGGMINYTVDWGDGTKSISEYSAASGVSVAMYHVYSGGKFIVKVTAVDPSGLSATRSHLVEVPRSSGNVNSSDFQIGPIGTTNGLDPATLLVTRDSQNVLTGVANFNGGNNGGYFFLRAYGDDVTTPTIDEGHQLSEVVKFYANGKQCIVTEGRNTWVPNSNSNIMLSCQ